MYSYIFIVKARAMRVRTVYSYPKELTTSDIKILLRELYCTTNLLLLEGRLRINQYTGWRPSATGSGSGYSCATTVEATSGYNQARPLWPSLRSHGVTESSILLLHGTQTDCWVGMG